MLAKYYTGFNMPPVRRLHGFPIAVGLLLARGIQMWYAGLSTASHVGFPVVIP